MKNYFVFFFVLILFESCADFIEYPLENVKIELQAPADQIIVKDSAVGFWWESHEDARFYRLQVVSPSFDKVDRMLIDSLISSNHLKITLDTGVYQWRVRPENYGSQGGFSASRSLVRN